MRIIGFNFRKVSAERKKEIKGKLEIKTHMDIEKIEKESLDIAGEVLRFSFVYEINYDPNNAKISFEGTVLMKSDKKEDMAKIINEWKKNKVPDEIKLLVFNFVMTKCNLKALQLEEEFSLPPHIPLPKLTPESERKETKANYAG
jgi:hypothetical protein